VQNLFGGRACTGTRVQIAPDKEVGGVIHLAAVAGSHEEEVGFCSHCGQFQADDRRVCSKCGLGVQLRTSAGVLRSPGASFLIVRGDGIVSAASVAAERMLGHTVGRHVRTVLSSNEVPPAVTLAAAGRPEPATFQVQEMTVTVAPCGDPPAALVVLERM
jgi:hypothetical protein